MGMITLSISCKWPLHTISVVLMFIFLTMGTCAVLIFTATSVHHMVSIADDDGDGVGEGVGDGDGDGVGDGDGDGEVVSDGCYFQLCFPWHTSFYYLV